MIRSTVFVAAALAFLTAPTYAASCKDDVVKINKAMETATLDADARQAVLDLRDQAIQLCSAGNEQQGLDQTAQAKAILNID